MMQSSMDYPLWLLLMLGILAVSGTIHSRRERVNIKRGQEQVWRDALLIGREHFDSAGEYIGPDIIYTCQRLILFADNLGEINLRGDVYWNSVKVETGTHLFVHGKVRAFRGVWGEGRFTPSDGLNIIY